jgi:hypothetical protein
MEIPPLIPRDVLLGLASAHRNLLATSLSLFEDSTLRNKLTQLYKIGKEKAEGLSASLKGEELRDTERSVTSSRDSWVNSSYTDSFLRLLLWLELREAFGLPALLSVSEKGTSKTADDLAAAVVSYANNEGLLKKIEKYSGRIIKIRNINKDTEIIKKTPTPSTLGEVIQPILTELSEKSMEDLEKLPPSEREAYECRAEETMLSKLQSMSEEDKLQLADQIGYESINDAAMAKIMMTTGSLGTLGVSMQLAGFSGYILAAKASAFLPFITGPQLVSLLHVFAEPVTGIPIAVGGGIWLKKRASDQTSREVGMRVTALLAMQGISDNHLGLKPLLDSFGETPNLKPIGRINLLTNVCYLFTVYFLQR